MADFFIIYTSLECGVCGNRDKANRKDKTILNALNCGYKTNSDIQASKGH